MGSGVQDNSDKVAQINADAAEKARLAEELRKKQEREAFDANLSSAYTSAIEEARRYFANAGLNPDEYLADITSAATAKKGTVPLLDSAPGTFFTGLGAQVFNDKQTGQRNAFLNDIDRFAGQGFEKSLISDTSDDSAIERFLADAYGDAESKLNLQRNRGVLTDGGFAEALKEITRQKGGARYNLDTIGQTVLQEGRNKLLGTVADARTNANNYRLGGTFNPFETQKTLGDQTSSFFSSLSDRLGSLVPDDLFDVSKAFNKGGVAQGPGNFGYDPQASAGLFALFDDQKKKKQATPSASPF